MRFFFQLECDAPTDQQTEEWTNGRKFHLTILLISISTSKKKS